MRIPKKIKIFRSVLLYATGRMDERISFKHRQSELKSEYHCVKNRCLNI